MMQNLPNPRALRLQHNGWSLERQQHFLDHLARHGNVVAAARHVGMSPQSAYWLRRQPHSADFARAWDIALADTGRWIEDLALDRLHNGEEEVIERDGVVVAVRRRPADVRLLLFYLKRQERQAVAEARQGPPDSASVAKVRAELRMLTGMDEPMDPAAENTGIPPKS